MSKKNKAIIDDDPLAWLSAGDATDSAIETKEVLPQNKAVVDSAIIKEPIEEAAIEQVLPNMDKEHAVTNAKGSPIDNASQDVEADKEQVTAMRDSVEQRSGRQHLSANYENKNSVEDNGLENNMVEENEKLIKGENLEEVKVATSDNEIIVLEEDVSIVQVSVLKETWLSALDSGKNIEIDASSVEDIDTTGLQLLLSLVKTLKESGRSVTWEKPSGAMIDAVKETSLKDALGIHI